MHRRHTVQRELVLDAVRGLGGHPTADEVHAEVARRHPSVGRGTVYRQLGHLAASGEIAKVAMPEGAGRFDGRTDPHCHARCLACGRLCDVDMAPPDAAELARAIRDSHGFAVSGCQLMLTGLCPECQERQHRQEEGEGAT